MGREVTREERNEYCLKLHELRSSRFQQEKEQEKELPKSKEEVELEQKVILTLNNLIVWLINDLTKQMRGNMVLRRVKENDADELYQHAILGLFYAIDNHDPAKAEGGKMLPYIMAYMEGYVRRTSWQEQGISVQKEQVRLPIHHLDLRRKIQSIERMVRSEYPSETDNYKMELRLVEALSKPEIGVLPEGSDIATLRRLREKLLMDYEEVAYEILDDENMDIDTQVSRLGGLLSSKPPQESSVEREQLEAEVNKVLMTLTPREERVLRLRFFPQPEFQNEEGSLGKANDTYHDGLSTRAVAEMFGVTHARIGQIEAKALRKLKNPSRSRKLRAFI